MPLYSVPVTVTYLDHVEVEADSPDGAMLLALEGGWDPSSVDMDVEPLLEVSGTVTLVERD